MIYSYCKMLVVTSHSSYPLQKLHVIKCKLQYIKVIQKRKKVIHMAPKNDLEIEWAYYDKV